MPKRKSVDEEANAGATSEDEGSNLTKRRHYSVSTASSCASLFGGRSQSTTPLPLSAAPETCFFELARMVDPAPFDPSAAKHEIEQLKAKREKFQKMPTLGPADRTRICNGLTEKIAALSSRLKKHQVNASNGISVDELTEFDHFPGDLAFLPDLLEFRHDFPSC